MGTSAASNNNDNNNAWGSNSVSDNANSENDSLFADSAANSTLGGWGTTSASEDQSSAWSTSSNKEIDNATINSESQHSEMQQDDNNSNVLSVDHDTSLPVWFMDRVCVTFISNETNGVINEVNKNTASIQTEDGQTIKSVKPTDIKLLPPKEHDMVLVTGGADVGVEAELVCIDGNDAILRDSSNEDFKIVDFCHLAKIKQDSS